MVSSLIHMRFSPAVHSSTSFVPFPNQGALVISFLQKVKISKKVKLFVWVLHSSVDTHDRIQQHSILVLYMEWCALCRWQEEDHDHLLWGFWFGYSLWSPCFSMFRVIVVVHNRSCCSMVEEIPMTSPFRDKVKDLWQACSFAILSGVWLEE